MGQTTPDGIYYPDDYEDPCDVPAVSQTTADTVQAALLARARVFVQTGAPTGQRVGDIWAPV